MQIKSVELKTASNGKQYKSIKFDQKFQDKDMVNVFAGTPHYNLNIGDSVDDSLLYINAKGYLEIKENKVAPSVSQPLTQGAEVKIGFLHQEVKVMHEKIDRILAKLDLQTPGEKVEAIRNQPAEEVNWDGAPPLTDDDVPF
jgi:hypothetical protein